MSMANPDIERHNMPLYIYNEKMLNLDLNPWTLIKMSEDNLFYTEFILYLNIFQN